LLEVTSSSVAALGGAQASWPTPPDSPVTATVPSAPSDPAVGSNPDNSGPNGMRRTMAPDARSRTMIWRSPRIAIAALAPVTANSEGASTSRGKATIREPPASSVTTARMIPVMRSIVT
jgi:hypothetical protein